MNIATGAGIRAITPFFPGLLLTAVIATGSIWLGNLAWLQAHGIGALTLAIVIGITLGNTLYPRLAPRAGRGVGFSKATLLRAGIILYGVRLTLQDIAQVGSAGIVIDALVLCSTFALAWWLGTRVLGLERNAALLIGAGSSICGAAAVMATEPVVKGRSEDVAVAVATVVVFGTVAMFLYPLLYQWGSHGGWMPLDDTAFGVFTGATVHEVAQVVAAGRAISAPAADAAVISKMVRVMMLAPFLVGLSTLLARRTSLAGADLPGSDRRSDGASSQRRGSISIPWFAFGFIAMVAFNSLQCLPAPWVDRLVQGDNLLLAMAMAALGLTTHGSALRQAGVRPMLLAAVLFGWLLGGGLLINLAVRALM